MNALDFLKAPDAGGIRPLYAVFGDEAYLRREAIHAIARLALGDAEDAELSVGKVPGSSATLAAVFDEVRTLPFLAPRRVVVVEDADPFVTAHRRELEDYAARPVMSGTLILSTKLWPSTTKLAKAVDKSGLAIECKAPAEKVLPAFLIALAKDKHGAKLSADAASLLVELIGAEVGLLAAEVQKLANSGANGAAIGREAVERLVSAHRVRKIWEVIEAATTGQGGPALEELDRLLADGEHPVGLLAAVGKSLGDVHHVGQLRRAKRDLRSACAEAGVSSWFADRIGRQHTHLGPDRVDKLPAMLLRADLDLKGTSTLTPRAVFERLLVELARPRRD